MPGTRLNEARIKRVQRRYTHVRRGWGRGMSQPRLVIDHQSFDIGEPGTRAHATWVTRQLAIALERMLYHPV